MSGPVWLRGVGLGVAGASAHALAGWWAVALVVGLFWVQMGFYWEARQRLHLEQRKAPLRRHLEEVRATVSGRVWDGQQWREP